MHSVVVRVCVCTCMHLLILSWCPLSQGKIEDNTFVVIDSFALPVEGTETRVTALEEGYEYMVRVDCVACVCVCVCVLRSKNAMSAWCEGGRACRPVRCL